MESPRLAITASLITEYKKSFGLYLKTKESERAQLCMLPRSSSWYGKILNTAIEYSLQKIDFGSINLEDAKIFLERIFDENKKNLLEDAITNLETSEHNIIYLQSLFNNLDVNALEKKQRSSMVAAMQTCKHPLVPDSDKFALKNETDEYLVEDSRFMPYAVTNLFAFHILESDLTIQKLNQQ